MRVKLTQAVIDSAKCPEHLRRVELVDQDCPGLYAIFSIAGKASSYFFRFKDFRGKTCHQKLGRTTDLKLVDARKKVAELRGALARGDNLRPEKKTTDASISFKSFFYDQYLVYAKPRKVSWVRDEQIFRLHLMPTLGDRAIGTITRRDLEELHTTLLNRGDLAIASVNHVAKLARRIFSICCSWDILPKNVCARFPLAVTLNRVNHKLSPEELKRLVTVLHTHPNRTVCLLCLWLLSTGARCGEARAATFDQIDRANRLWTIPAANSKSKRSRTVPLNQSAMDVLDQLDSAGSYQHLFINRKTRLPYSTISKSFDRIRKTAGLPNLLTHSLRREYASLLVSAGTSLYTLQTILGHSDPKITMLYATVNTEALHLAANNASIKIKAAMDGAPA